MCSSSGTISPQSFINDSHWRIEIYWQRFMIMATCVFKRIFDSYSDEPFLCFLFDRWWFDCWTCPNRSYFQRTQQTLLKLSIGLLHVCVCVNRREHEDKDIESKERAQFRCPMALSREKQRERERKKKRKMKQRTAVQFHSLHITHTRNTSSSLRFSIRHYNATR